MNTKLKRQKADVKDLVGNSYIYDKTLQSRKYLRQSADDLPPNVAKPNIVYAKVRGSNPMTAVGQVESLTAHSLKPFVMQGVDNAYMPVTSWYVRIM